MTEYCTASFDRQTEWEQSCAAVMGYDWIPKGEQHQEYLLSIASATEDALMIQVTNLLPETFYFEEEEEKEDGFNDIGSGSNSNSNDPWTESAVSIQQDIQRMSDWIQKKKRSFLGVTMTDGEASIIQSTVTTFAATTGSEIETLRQIAADNNNNNKATAVLSDNMKHHRSGVVQILMNRLKEEIIDPFSFLQKQRSRKALRIWQEPLQCKLLVVEKQDSSSSSMKDELDHALGLADDNDGIMAGSSRQESQKFAPSKDVSSQDQDGEDFFLSLYALDENSTAPSERPESSILYFNKKFERRQPSSSSSSSQKLDQTKYDLNEAKSQLRRKYPQQQEQQKQQQKVIPQDGGDNNENYYTIPEAEELEREATVLTAIMKNDLDSVQKVEQRMVDITNLLSQFSELVSEQREEVLEIHDSTVTTKENMKKGQESLVDATERTNTSSHTFAKSILGMAFVLLLFHFLRP